MKYKKFLMMVSMSLLMFGCKAQTSSNDQAASTTPAPAPVVVAATTKPTASEILEPKLKKDMLYADLRKIVLADGWLPLQTEACKENVGGEAVICDEQPEVEACSGDGYCNMWFLDAAMTSRLHVGTYDEATKFFEFTPVAQSSSSVTCPSKDFEKFLHEFSNNKAVQNAFTAPFVKVMDMIDLGDGYVERQIYVAASDYKDFDLQYIKNGFHVLNSDDEPDATATPVEIKEQGPDSYFVKYFYGMSEGNSYTFKNKNDCWYLTEDPEAPSP